MAGTGKVGEFKRRKLQFSSAFIYMALKQVHPDMEISSKGMNIMNSFINDLCERIAYDVALSVRFNKRRALTVRDIRYGVRVLLSVHALSTANIAVSKHTSFKH